MAEPVNLRAIIKAEYKKCIEDPIYFMKKYVKIQHPIKGTINFDLFPFQEKTLQQLVNQDFNIILKSRQMGISTLMAAYSLWLMTFHKDKNILCLSITQETAKEIVTRVRFANDNLPTWLKVESSEDNRLSLRLVNGSQIKAVSSASTAGRSAALSLLIIDECGFIEGVEEIWLSAQYTLSTGGRSVILSCVTDDTFVYTSRGIQQIKEFVPTKKIGDYIIDEYSVFGVDKERSSNLFKVNGNTDTIKITTKYSELESSKIHKIWAYKLQSHEFDWTEVQSLTTDDWISMQINMDVWGNENNINFQPSNKLKNTINVDFISTDLSYLFGLYIAEGYGRKVYNKNSEVVGGDIIITCGDPEITWVFDKLKLQYSSSDMLHYTISSKNLIELFEYVGFDLSNTSNKKEIPNRLLKMSKDNIIWLLKGIFDGDGSASKGEILLTSSSENLINQVRAILINFGILSCKRRIKKEKLNEYKSVKHKFNHDIFNLNIYGKHALKYFNTIGFNLNRKNDKKYLVSDKNLYRNSSHDTIPNTLELIKKLYKLSGLNTVKFKKLYGISLNGIINSKTKYKTNNISREIVLTLYNTFKHLLSEDEQLYWDKIINNNIAWVQIKNIEHNSNDVYDFSLPNDKNDFWCHSVIYNGIIGHQTPNGVGNFFHKTWVDAEEGKNKFNTIRLPWHLHPERDQSWRDQQTLLSGVKGAAQECDCIWGESKIKIKDTITGEIQFISLEKLYEIL